MGLGNELGEKNLFLFDPARLLLRFQSHKRHTTQVTKVDLPLWLKYERYQKNKLRKMANTRCTQ